VAREHVDYCHNQLCHPFYEIIQNVGEVPPARSIVGRDDAIAAVVIAWRKLTHDAATVLAA